jgi:hypothetical protein
VTNLYIEILSAPPAEESKEESKEEDKKEEPASSPTIKKLDKKTINLIASSISDLADESGWAFLGEVGNLILKKEPDFDARNYGFKKLGQLIKSTQHFEIDERLTDKGNIKHVYIKTKPVNKKRSPSPKKANSKVKPVEKKS